MATTVDSIVQQVRNVMGDYGSAQCVLDTTVDTDDTTFLVDDASGFETGWAAIDYEMLRITAVDKVASPNSLEVKRAQRGTTAATHTAGANCYMKPMFSSNHILDRMNAAVARAYPKLYDKVFDTWDSADLTDEQNVYTMPTGMESLILVELQANPDNSTSGPGAKPYRHWQMFGDGKVQLFGDFADTDTFYLTGTAHFAALTSSGNLPTELDTSARMQWLVMQTNVYLLMDQQTMLARRDSLLGNSDRFGANYPFSSGSSARELQAQADRLLASCKMESIPTYSLAPMRHYYAR